MSATPAAAARTRSEVAIRTDCSCEPASSTTARVFHSLVRRRDALRPIGHTGAALVETDKARESRESLAPPHPRRLLPIERQVREPTRNHQHLRWAVADHLIGDARLATPGV